MAQENFEQREKYRPRIEFNIDRETEVDVFVWLWREGRCLYPGLEYLMEYEDEEAVRREVAGFVDKYYNDHEGGIQDRINEVEREWSAVEDSYYAEIDRLLSGHPWPRGRYRAIASIWDSVYPRDIDNKWFTFPLGKKWGAKPTIAHEMTHFIVYDWLERKYGLEPSECDDDDNFFWQFTENFNSLLEKEPFWEEFMEGRDSKVKPDCRELYGEMKKVWDKDNDADRLVRKIFGDRIIK